LPLVGVVVLLVILIFLTPNLTSTGTPAAGTLQTAAELIVDHVPPSNTTHFYVRGIGTVRYVEIVVRVATNLSLNPIPRVGNLSFHNATSSTYSLGVSYTTTQNPIALNVTATYRDSQGACVQDANVYAFFIQPTSLLTIELAPTASSPQSTPLSALPLILLLDSSSIGGC
jgi:hypothetical protein